MMEHIDPQLQAAWEENLKLQERVERLRDDLSEARKVIADVKALCGDNTDGDDRIDAIQERLDEYAGT